MADSIYKIFSRIAQPDLGGTWYYDIIETESVSFEYE